MSTIEQNKQLAVSYIELLGSGRVDEAFALIDDDVEWIVPQSLSKVPIQKEHVRQRAKDLHRISDGTFRQWVVSMTAEEDRVAMEVASYAKLPSGLEYQNRYHYLLVITGGKVVKFRAYHDSAHAIEVLFTALQPHPGDAPAEPAQT